MRGYCFLWAEPDGSVLIRHPAHGRQLWSPGNIVAATVDPLTDQVLCPRWLCYAPPAEAPNAEDRLGDWGVQKLLKYPAKMPE